MKYNNIIYTEGNDIFNAFANFFENVYVQKELKNYDFSMKLNTQISSIQLNYNDIQNSILSLKNDMSPGPGGIYALFVKYPIFFKRSYIVTIHKSNKKDCIENYRPISIIGSVQGFRYGCV